MFENEKFDRPDFCDFKTIIEKFLTICLPVTTTPCAKVGNIKTECCGTPIVVPRKHDICCDEMQKNGCCKYTIIQKMKVEIPIDFTADTKVDDLFVCGGIHPSDGASIVEEKLDTVPARVTSIIDTSCQPNANLR